MKISPCQKYLARYHSKHLEILQISNSKIYRDYEVEITDLNFQWEEIIPGSETTKIAVIVQSSLVIFDLKEEESKPITIRQSKFEGIEYFQWIPPIQRDPIGAYDNSIQLIIYSKNNLIARVYSLDCTRMLFEIFKPVTRLIIRPDRKFWSIVANNFEYNSLPKIFHFYNKNSTSALVASYQLKTNLITTPQIEWSPKGNWLQIFNPNDNLLDYNLSVYNLEKSPIINFENSPFHGNNELNNGIYKSCWLNDELLMILNFNTKVKIQILSMKVLRIVKTLEIEMPKLKLHASSITVLGRNICFVLNKMNLLCYTDQFKLRFTFSGRILQLHFDKILYIATDSQILTYDQSLKTIYDSSHTIHKVAFLDNSILVSFYNDWELIPKTKKHYIDITDTFIHKKAKV